MGSVEGLADLVDGASVSLAIQAGCRIVQATQRLAAALFCPDAILTT